MLTRHSLTHRFIFLIKLQLFSEPDKTEYKRPQWAWILSLIAFIFSFGAYILGNIALYYREIPIKEGRERVADEDTEELEGETKEEGFVYEAKMERLPTQSDEEE